MSDRVTIFEMAPRDGLQNEKRLVPTAEKISLINELSACGFAKIETASFVSPRWVPQMADAAEVLGGITRKPGVAYTALAPNLRGYAGARQAQADEIAVFAAASDGFSRANINCSVVESLERLAPVVAAATADGIPVRGYVSCVISCPYDGDISPETVADVAMDLINIGCYEVSLGDTIGAGAPETIAVMLDAVLDRIPADRLAGHYHDTGGRALDNISISLNKGLRVFDASVGGLGGCPYAPGAKGNVDTLAVFDRLSAAGIETGLDRAALVHAAALARQITQREGAQ